MVLYYILFFSFFKSCKTCVVKILTTPPIGFILPHRTSGRTCSNTVPVHVTKLLGGFTRNVPALARIEVHVFNCPIGVGTSGVMCALKPSVGYSWRVAEKSRGRRTFLSVSGGAPAAQTHPSVAHVVIDLGTRGGGGAAINCVDVT